MVLEIKVRKHSLFFTTRSRVFQRISGAFLLAKDVKSLLLIKQRERESLNDFIN